MLVFVDESGDPGLKIGRGSSPYFTVTTVVFPTGDIARRCQEAIKQFRSDRSLKQYKEFHFSKDSPDLREGFLRAIVDFEFWYSSAVVDKSQLESEVFSNKESLYKHTVDLAFTNILDELENAAVVFDACGGREFGNQLRTYVQQRAREHTPDGSRIKQVRSRKSKTDDLIQLADMVCGAVARSYSDKSDRRRYRNILRKREMCVQVWPAVAAGAQKNPPT